MPAHRHALGCGVWSVGNAMESSRLQVVSKILEEVKRGLRFGWLGIAAVVNFSAVECAGWRLHTPRTGLSQVAQGSYRDEEIALAVCDGCTPVG